AEADVVESGDQPGTGNRLFGWCDDIAWAVTRCSTAPACIIVVRTGTERAPELNEELTDLMAYV
ncbi:MAG TPA: hypothetical protein VFL63_02320, partial [Rhodanobacteraceae bacterium]|nr:hypothetical protein [Rhodanobacteraceae bacterium]